MDKFKKQVNSFDPKKDSKKKKYICITDLLNLNKDEQQLKSLIEETVTGKKKEIH